jgi:hypothetical protein
MQVMELKSASLSPAASKEGLASGGFDDQGSVSVSSRTSKRRAKDLVSKYTRSNSLKDEKDTKEEAPTEQRELEQGTNANETSKVRDEPDVREEVPVTEESEFTNDIIRKIDSWTSTISRKILSKTVSFSQKESPAAEETAPIVPSASKDMTVVSKANSKAESTVDVKSETKNDENESVATAKKTIEVSTELMDNIASDAEKVILSSSNEQEQQSLCSKTSQSAKSKASLRSVKSSKGTMAKEKEIDDHKSVKSSSSLKIEHPEDAETVVSTSSKTATSKLSKLSLKKSRDTHESNHVENGSIVEKCDEVSVKATSVASVGEMHSADQPAIANDTLGASKDGKEEEASTTGSRSIGKSTDGKDVVGIKEDEASTTGKSISSRSAKQGTRSATGSVANSRVSIPSVASDEESKVLLTSASSRSGKKNAGPVVASSRSVASKAPIPDKPRGSQDSAETAQTADSMATSTCSTCHNGVRFFCSWFG